MRMRIQQWSKAVRSISSFSSSYRGIAQYFYSGGAFAKEWTRGQGEAYAVLVIRWEVP